MTHLLKESIANYLNQIESDSELNDQYFASLLAQIEAGDFFTMDIEEVGEKVDQHNTAFRRAAIEDLLNQVDMLINLGYHTLTDQEIESLKTQALFETTTVADVIAILKDRIHLDKASYQERAAELVSLLQEHSTEVEKKEVLGTLLLAKQATQALVVLDSISEQLTTLEELGIAIPVDLAQEELKTSSVATTEGLLSLKGVSDHYGVSYDILKGLVARNRWQENVHYVRGLSQKNRPARFVTEEGIAWLQEHGLLQDAEGMMESLEEKVEFPLEGLSDSVRFQALAAVLRTEADGRFTYTRIKDIVASLLPDDADEHQAILLYNNVSNAKSTFRQQLEPDISAEQLIMTEVIEIYLANPHRGQATWDPIFEYVRDTYGDLTLDEFTTGVWNRFETKLPTGWSWLADYVSDEDKEAVGQVCRGQLKLGREYREVRDGIQLSPEGVRFVEMLFADERSQEWKDRMAKRISWNGEFQLHRFLSKEVADPSGRRVTIYRYIETEILPLLGHQSLTDYARDLGIAPDNLDALPEWIEQQSFEGEYGEGKPKHLIPFEGNVQMTALREVEENFTALDPLEERDSNQFHQDFDDWLGLLVTPDPELDMPAYKLIAALCSDFYLAINEGKVDENARRQLTNFLHRLSEWFRELKQSTKVRYGRGLETPPPSAPNI